MAGGNSSSESVPVRPVHVPPASADSSRPHPASADEIQTLVPVELPECWKPSPRPKTTATRVVQVEPPSAESAPQEPAAVPPTPPITRVFSVEALGPSPSVRFKRAASQIYVVPIPARSETGNRVKFAAAAVVFAASIAWLVQSIVSNESGSGETGAVPARQRDVSAASGGQGALVAAAPELTKDLLERNLSNRLRPKGWVEKFAGNGPSPEFVNAANLNLKVTDKPSR